MNTFQSVDVMRAAEVDKAGFLPYTGELTKNNPVPQQLPFNGNFNSGKIQITGTMSIPFFAWLIDRNIPKDV
ncbi:MAG: hypothetical protein ACRCXT_08205 [Paraclostridium sp.]